MQHPDTEMAFEKTVSGIIRGMKPISLEEISAVKLMDRNDFKFLLPVSMVPAVLSRVVPDYFVQEIDGIRIASYETLYYDTSAYRFYNDHTKGKLNRCKVRKRSYLDCDLHFLEVKRKTNTGKTKKSRIILENKEGIFGESHRAFIAKYGCPDLFLLFPVLTNYFRRITLVNKEKSERITIDYGLRFAKAGNGREIELPHLAIIEIKQEKNSSSQIKKVLSSMRIKMSGFSKYCTGLFLLTPAAGIKSYKRKLRYIEKITNHEHFA